MSSKGKRDRERRRITWDEDNLAHLEETKTPKQRITEPKTPYHTLSLDPDEANALSPMQLPNSDTEAGPAALNPEQVCSALAEVASEKTARVRRRGGGGWTSSEDEADQGEFEKWMEDRVAAGQEGPSVTFQGTEDYYGTNVTRSDKAFKEHRRRHYDEFRKLKLLRAQGRKDDLDETETGAEENGPGGRGGAGSSGGEQGYWGGGESDVEVKRAKGPHFRDGDADMAAAGSQNGTPGEGSSDDAQQKDDVDGK